jgi:hypothetical protein
MLFILIANTKMGAKTLLCNTPVEVALGSLHEDVFQKLVGKGYGKAIDQSGAVAHEYSPV